MTSLTLDETQLRRRNRGRLQLLLILAVVFGPMLLATGMYKFRFWVPESRSYHGELIANGSTPADLGVQADAASDRWQLLVTAPAACAARRSISPPVIAQLSRLNEARPVAAR